MTKVEQKELPRQIEVVQEENCEGPKANHRKSSSIDSLFKNLLRCKKSLGSRDKTFNALTFNYRPEVAVLASKKLVDFAKDHGFVNFGDLLKSIASFCSNEIEYNSITDQKITLIDWGVKFVSLPCKKSMDTKEGYELELEDYQHQLIKINEFPWTNKADFLAIERILQFDLLEKDKNWKSSTAVCDHSPSTYSILFEKLVCGMPVCAQESFSHPAMLLIAVSVDDEKPVDELLKIYNTSLNIKLPEYMESNLPIHYLVVDTNQVIGEDAQGSSHEDFVAKEFLFCQSRFESQVSLLRLCKVMDIVTGDNLAKYLKDVDLHNKFSDAKKIEANKLKQEESVVLIQNIRHQSAIEFLYKKSKSPPWLLKKDIEEIQKFISDFCRQVMIPMMTSKMLQWNERVVQPRKGITAKLMSVSKIFSSDKGPVLGDYNFSHSCYNASTSEAQLRRLADFAFILQDYKYAQQIYELFKKESLNSSAWSYYAAANEMMLLSTLLGPDNYIKPNHRDSLVSKMLESYFTKCFASLSGTKSALMICEALYATNRPQDAEAATDWMIKLLEIAVPRRLSFITITERIAEMFYSRESTTLKPLGVRWRKSALWYTIAAQHWLRIEQYAKAFKCLQFAQNKSKSMLQWPLINARYTKISETLIKMQHAENSISYTIDNEATDIIN